MPRVRLSSLARADVHQILHASEQDFGIEARRRYATLIAVALRELARHVGILGLTPARGLMDECLTFHLIYARKQAAKRGGLVKRPRHRFYLRRLPADILLVSRLLHESMDPTLHILPNEADP